MAELLISRVSPGVVLVRTTDPFSSLEVHRIDRKCWHASPERPGIYLLFGFVNDRPAAYVGMSTTSILGRIRSHHVSERKNWFGTLFAIPLNAVLCQPVEAEMIRRISEAGIVDFVDNRVQPTAFLDAEDVHVTPAVEAITDTLEVLLGSDIFSPPDDDDELPGNIMVSEKVAPLARVYRGAAAQPRQRNSEDPASATHTWVGSGVRAWGRFEGPEPDQRFLVFASSQYRPAIVNPSHATYGLQQRVEQTQQALVNDGTLDHTDAVFVRDHLFPNWSQASYVVSGKATYSGGYHWQELQ